MNTTATADKDAFDCSNLGWTPTQRVEEILEQKAAEWQELDSRIISQEECGDVFGKINTNYQSRSYHPSPRYINRQRHADRIRLDGFNWTCSSNGSDHLIRANKYKKEKRRKVVINPKNSTATLDYNTELMKIFDSIPSEDEILNDGKDTSLSCISKSLALREEVQSGFSTSTRFDAHGLCRMRKRTVHHVPILHNHSGISRPRPDSVAVKLECWRGKPRCAPATHHGRLEMEFSGEQTLLDVHRAIVGLTYDKLFEDGRKIMDRSDDGSNGKIHDKQPGRPPESSGMFFIEDTFYTVGDVNYATPVIRWLDRLDEDDDTRKTSSKIIEGAKKRGRKRKPKKIPCRRSFLGISPDCHVSVVPMEQVTLDSVRFRLGVRYCHVFHGDCETALFFSDVRARNSKEEPLVGPILHDTWSAARVFHMCKGCDRSLATVVTVEDMKGDGGPTFLCSICYRMMHYKPDIDRSEGIENGSGNLRCQNFRVYPLHVLRNQQELSTGRLDNNAFF